MSTNSNYTADYFSKNIGRFSKFLQHLDAGPCHLLEIGCFEGRSTRWLLDHIAVHPESTVSCVDIYWQPLFLSNMKGQFKVNLHEGPSRAILPTLPRQHFDFIYVDGSHETIDVLEDAVLSFRLLKTGGILGFDDYRWKNKERGQKRNVPKPAIDAFRKIYKRKIDALTTFGSYQYWARKLSD